MASGNNATGLNAPIPRRHVWGVNPREVFSQMLWKIGFSKEAVKAICGKGFKQLENFAQVTKKALYKLGKDICKHSPNVLIPTVPQQKLLVARTYVPACQQHAVNPDTKDAIDNDEYNEQTSSYIKSKEKTKRVFFLVCK